MLYNLDKDKSLKLSCGLTTVAIKQGISRAVSCFNFYEVILWIMKSILQRMDVFTELVKNLVLGNGQVIQGNLQISKKQKNGYTHRNTISALEDYVVKQGLANMLSKKFKERGD